MGDKTGIEWTDATWNPLVGCSVVSPGCTNCYAMKMADRLESMVQSHIAANGGDPGPMAHYEGTTTRGQFGNKPPVWTGKVNRAPDTILTQPLRWTRPRRVFVNSMSDLFHESVPDEWIDEIFAVMALCPQHTFQILTKRPERMRGYLQTDGVQERIYKSAFKYHMEKQKFLVMNLEGWPIENIWLGVSVEDQRRANKNIRDLLYTPAAVRFLSIEPLISAVDLNGITSPAIKDDGKVPLVMETCLYTIADRPAILPLHDTAKIDWVIVGGESGPDARPMHPDWVRFLRDQCNTAGVPFLFKQWGRWAPLLPEHEGRKDWMIVDHAGGVDIPDGRGPDEQAGEVAMVALGKGKAGRTLDGRTWDEMPKGGADVDSSRKVH